MSLTDVIENAKAAAAQERLQWKARVGDAAAVLHALPELMVEERQIRGLSRQTAATQAGVQHNTWASLETRRRASHTGTSVRVLEWIARG